MQINETIKVLDENLGTIKHFHFICKMTEEHLSQHDVKPRHKTIIEFTYKTKNVFIT